MKVNNNIVINKTNLSVQHFRFKFMLILTCVVFVFATLLTYAISRQAESTMRVRLSGLIGVNTEQRVMNVDSYMMKIRDTASLFFSDKEYYGYSSTDDIDDFEKIQSEKVILDRIQNLGMLENFSDFGVFYSDDHSVGWISETTYKMVTEGKLYDFFEENITDEKTESGWFATDKNNYDRIFYVKRLNPNALLVTSFYSREIETVFTTAKNMEEMVVRLVDDEKRVLYSSNRDEIGLELDSSIADAISGKSNVSAIENGNMITSSTCSVNGWNIVCTMPENVIMSDINRLKHYMYAFSAIGFVLVLVLGCVVLSKASNPVSSMMSSLEHKADYDQLTGVLNKMSFKDMVLAVLAKNTKGATDVFVMMDMDNFKSVNDTLGHDAGDAVLVRFSDILKRVFGTTFMVGRLGGDEFAVYTRIEKSDVDSAKLKLRADMQLLKDEFSTEFKSENESCNLSLSAGVTVVESGSMSFDELYKASDNILYSSKRSGKNRYSFY